MIWAATWENQQNDCAPSEDSDQPGHPPSLIRVFAVRSRTQAFFMRATKTLIRLGGCPGWSESSLGANSFCWFCYVAAHIKVASQISAVVSVLVITSLSSCSGRKTIKNEATLYWTTKTTHHFSNAFNIALTLTLCILKVTDAIGFKVLLPFHHE